MTTPPLFQPPRRCPYPPLLPHHHLHFTGRGRQDAFVELSPLVFAGALDSHDVVTLRWLFLGALSLGFSGLSRGLMIEKIQGARWRLAYFLSYRRGAETIMVLLMAALHDLRL